MALIAIYVCTPNIRLSWYISTHLIAQTREMSRCKLPLLSQWVQLSTSALGSLNCTYCTTGSTSSLLLLSASKLTAACLRLSLQNTTSSICIPMNHTQFPQWTYLLCWLLPPVVAEYKGTAAPFSLGTASVLCLLQQRLSHCLHHAPLSPVSFAAAVVVCPVLAAAYWGWNWRHCTAVHDLPRIDTHIIGLEIY